MSTRNGFLRGALALAWALAAVACGGPHEYVTETGAAGGGGASGGEAPAPARRFVISVREVAYRATPEDPEIAEVARRAVHDALAQRRDVVPVDAPYANLEGAHSRHRFDVAVAPVEPRGRGLRVAVTVTVATDPEGQREFESESATTLTRELPREPEEARRFAVRRAVASAVDRALDQLQQDAARR